MNDSTRLSRKRVLEILKNAIIAYESELEHQDYKTEEELHQVVLNEFDMADTEYEYVFDYNAELALKKDLFQGLIEPELIIDDEEE